MVIRAGEDGKTVLIEGFDWRPGKEIAFRTADSLGVCG